MAMPRKGHIPAAILAFLFLGMAHGSGSVPALFIFGDSTVDAGNNNYIKTKANANFGIYGEDLHGMEKGRFTNGRTWIDFIDEFLGLEYQLPVLNKSVSEEQKLNGLNYGSASSGILDNTGVGLAGANINLTAQIGLFRNTLNNMRAHYKNDLKTFLRKSIFVLSIGSNDIIETTLHPPADKEDYAQSLVDILGDRIKDLYTMGARKFVVTDVGEIGCTPFVKNVKLKNVKSKDCDGELNSLAQSYNKRLATKLRNLDSSLSGSFFVTVKASEFMRDRMANYGKYSFKGVVCEGCLSLPDPSNPKPMPSEECLKCEGREYIMWKDGQHPTEKYYKLLATACYNGNGVCVPINIQQLATVTP